jgi:two-component system cell cycle sensor histidine kinase/response regulator CckA
MSPREPEMIALLERSPAAIAVLDEQGSYVVRSVGLEQITGYGNIDGMHVLEAIQQTARGEAAAQLRAEWRRHRATGEPVSATVPFEHAGGEQRWARLHLSSHGGYRLLNAVDVTELLETQQALAESEALHRKIVENIPVGIYSLSEPMSGKISSVNPALTRILGYDDPSEVIGNSSAIVYEHPEDRARVVQGLLDNEFQQSNTIQVELPLIRRNRERFIARLTIHGTFDDQQRLRRVDGVVQDITEQRAQQRALEESEQRFRSFFDSSPLGKAIQVGGAIVRANPALCQMLRMEPEELVGKTMEDLTHPDDLAASRAAVRAMRAGAGPVRQLEKRYLRGDGTVLFARTTATQGQGGGHPDGVTFVMIEDISERRAMEDDLLRIQKLESLGVLAGGIAHDFNNMLQGVLGHVSMVRDQLEPDSPLSAYLERAETAANRARDLTLQLQTFASGGHPIRRVVRLEDVVHESVALSFRGRRVLPELHIASDLPLVELDVAQAGQAFNNLFINAIQAMPEGGMVTITLEPVQLALDEQPALPPGRYLRLVVSDRGVGIPPGQIERIFDPYFTTKRGGRGLGLATAFSVVKRHGGHLLVDSAPGEGSSFTVLLPCTEAEEPEPLHPPECEPGRGEGRVLVMDDEASIRELVCDLLGHFGYQVEAARDGDEALEMARRAVLTGRPYQVAILDLTIPGGRGGREIILELQEIDPQLRAIVMSGYTTDTTLAQHRAFGFDGAVAKPCSAKALVAELQRVLEH